MGSKWRRGIGSANPVVYEEFCKFIRNENTNALPDSKLSVQFAEGVTKIYDVSILFEKHKMFLPLKDNPALFGDVVVDQGGYGIVWNDDMCP